jgi:hypothetical protein
MPEGSGPAEKPGIFRSSGDMVSSSRIGMPKPIHLNPRIISAQPSRRVNDFLLRKDHRVAKGRAIHPESH